MGCLLGSQSGRSIDISNSFEMNYTAEADGGVTVDYPFLLKKQEQCAYSACLHPPNRLNRLL